MFKCITSRYKKALIDKDHEADKKKIAEEAREAEKTRTAYSLRARCINCNLGDPRTTFGITLLIPRGVLSKDYFKDYVCPNCGCVGTFEEAK